MTTEAKQQQIPADDAYYLAASIELLRDMEESTWRIRETIERMIRKLETYEK